MAKIQIKKQPNNLFRFTMKTGSGRTILISEPFNTKEDCLKGIDIIKRHAMDKARYDFKKSLNLKHYINLTDVTGRIIGSSEMYESSSGRDMGVELLRMNAATAILEDLT